MTLLVMRLVVSTVTTTMLRDHVTFIIIQGTNLEMRVQTPGKLASAQPIPHEIIPAKKYRPSWDFTCTTRNKNERLTTSFPISFPLLELKDSLVMDHQSHLGKNPGHPSHGQHIRISPVWIPGDRLSGTYSCNCHCWLLARIPFKENE